MVFQWAIGCKGLKHIEGFHPLSQSGTLRKKTVYNLKVFEIDHNEISLSIFSILIVINFNKAGKFLCCRIKTTSQGLIKKMFLGFDKINNSYKSDRYLEIIGMGALICNVLMFYLD